MTDLIERSKGVLDIGSRCHQCGAGDFLPFKCDICHEDYCTDHRMPESHGCVRPSRPVSSLSKPASKSPAPKSPASTPTPRQSQSPSPSSSGTNATIDRIKAFWASRTTKRTPVNKHIVVAKMKSSAKGDPPSTPTQNRVYLHLERPPAQYTDAITNQQATRPGKKVTVYFDKNIVVGRLVDRACVHLDVTNKNSVGGTRLGLYLHDQLLPHDVKLAEILEDGDSLVLR